MTCKFKNHNSKFVRRPQYEIWGFSEQDDQRVPPKLEKVRTYFVLDDDYEFCRIDEAAIEIIDNSLDGYKLMDTFSNSKFILYLKTDVLPLLDKNFINGWNLTGIQISIWGQTRLAKILRDKGEVLSEKLINALENENDKLLLIQGFLDFANHYINYKQDSDLVYHLGFCKTNKDIFSEDYNYLTEVKTIFEVKKENIYKEFLEFINQALFNGDKIIIYPNQDASYSTSKSLLMTIDSIFVNGIEAAYIIERYWDTRFAIKYNGYYYVLEYGFSD